MSKRVFQLLRDLNPDEQLRLIGATAGFVTGSLFGATRESNDVTEAVFKTTLLAGSSAVIGGLYAPVTIPCLASGIVLGVPLFYWQKQKHQFSDSRDEGECPN